MKKAPAMGAVVAGDAVDVTDRVTQKWRYHV